MSMTKNTSVLDVQPPESAQPISEETVLRLLNDAVWAPNDELREPWRFVYAAGSSVPAESAESAEACLIVVQPLSADPTKRLEDFSACACLVENFRLLGRELGWGVTRKLDRWTYETGRLRELGIGEQERIAAVLEMTTAPAHAKPAEPRPIDFSAF